MPNRQISFEDEKQESIRIINNYLKDAQLSLVKIILNLLMLYKKQP